MENDMRLNNLENQEGCVLELPDSIIHDLKVSIANGMIAEIRPDGNHIYWVEKAQVDIFKGFKVEIFSNEHPPPHFHVTFRGDTASFALDDCRLLQSSGSKGVIRKIKKNIELYHKENREKLFEFWNTHRPSDCPVGPVAL